MCVKLKVKKLSVYVCFAAKKTKKQVFVSYSLPMTDSNLSLLVENRIKKELELHPEHFWLFIELSFCVGKKANASPVLLLDLTFSFWYCIVHQHNNHKRSQQVFFYWRNKLSGLLSKHVGLWLFVQMHHIKKITLRKKH